MLPMLTDIIQSGMWKNLYQYFHILSTKTKVAFLFGMLSDILSDLLGPPEHDLVVEWVSVYVWI